MLAGALILCPMAIFGPINGTNNAVSSSAHLGVHGRIVGSFLSLLTAVAFFSLAVWSSGDALVGGAHRLFGMPRRTVAYVAAYAVFAGLVLIVCTYGFRFMLFVNKIAVVSATLLFVLGIVAFAGDFDPSFAGTSDSLFWPSFIGSALIVLANPVSFGAFLGDWSRYIPSNTPHRRVVTAAFLSQVATLVPFLFGLATAGIIATTAPSYVDPASPDFVGGLLAFVGPLGDLAGGVDVGLPLSIGIAAVLYLALLFVFPEPRGVYGPAGPRLVRAADVAVPPITGPGKQEQPVGSAPEFARPQAVPHE